MACIVKGVAVQAIPLLWGGCVSHVLHLGVAIRAICYHVSCGVARKATLTTKNLAILDGFKPFRNCKKLSGKRSSRFFLDGFKPSKNMCR
jgi:hypothetical protein